MRIPIVLPAVALACGWLFFFALYSRRNPELSKRYTLSEIYGSYLEDLPSDRIIFAPLLLAGLVAAFYPLILSLIARIAGSTASTNIKGWILAGALVSLIGVVANILAMLLAQMSFGFCSSTSFRDRTIYLWIIPIFQTTFAAAGIAFCISRWFAKAFHAFVSF